MGNNGVSLNAPSRGQPCPPMHSHMLGMVTGHCCRYFAFKNSQGTRISLERAVSAGTGTSHRPWPWCACRTRLGLGRAMASMNHLSFLLSTCLIPFPSRVGMRGKSEGFCGAGNGFLHLEEEHWLPKQSRDDHVVEDSCPEFDPGEGSAKPA